MTDVPAGPSYVYRATLHRVIDGDTYELAVDLGFKVDYTPTIRLRGVDCPEMSTPEGKVAKSAAVTMLDGRPLMVRSYKDRQSFARWVADVWVQSADGWGSVADRLLAGGFAVPLIIP